MGDVTPIRSDADHAAALAELSSLMDAPPGSAEEARLEALSILVHSYEARRWPVEALDPIDFLREAMELCGIARKDLERAIGSRARVTEILNRRRALTLPMIRALHREFGLPAQSLIGEYKVARLTPGARGRAAPQARSSAAAKRRSA